MNNTTDGNNDRETGIRRGRGVARKYGPTPRFSELLFQRVRRKVAGGGAVGEAIRAQGMGSSRFYECVAARPRLAVDLQYARENKLPAHMSTRAAGRSTLRPACGTTEDGSQSGGRVKARFTLDLRPDAVRQLSDRMLMLLLKQLAPEKYGSMTPPCTQSACGGEALEQRAESRGLRSDENSETKESACDFVPQDVGGELLTPRDCPEMEGKAEGSMLNAKVRNNENSTGSASGEQAGEEMAEIRGQRSEEIPKTPESCGDFVPQVTDAEWALRLECPEFAGSVGTRGGGVKAVEDNRSPSPGGTAERRETQGQLWGLRRWAIEAGGGMAGNTGIGVRFRFA